MSIGNQSRIYTYTIYLKIISKFHKPFKSAIGNASNASSVRLRTYGTVSFYQAKVLQL